MPNGHSVKPFEVAPEEPQGVAPPPPGRVKPFSLDALPEPSRHFEVDPTGAVVEPAPPPAPPANLPFSLTFPNIPKRVQDVARVLVVEQVKDVSEFVRVGMKSLALTAGSTPAGRQRIFESIASEPPSAMERAQRGAALVASFYPAGRGLQIAERLGFGAVGKALSFLAGEFAGGSIYGAIEPLEEGQSRTANVLKQGGLFAAAGGLFAGAPLGVAAAYRKYIQLRLGSKGVQRAKEILDALEREGASLNALPEDVRNQVLEKAYRQTVEELEPNAVKVDDFVSRELAASQRAIEPAPRFAEERPKIGVEPAPGERALDLPDPERPFEFSEPFEVPPKAEPASAPPGFEPRAAPILERDVDKVLEPQAVTPPLAPPSGFEPTTVGAAAKGFAGEVETLALGDAAVRDAVARIDPLELAKPSVKGEAALIKEQLLEPAEAPMRSNEAVRKALEKAMTQEKTAAEEGVKLALVGEPAVRKPRAVEAEAKAKRKMMTAALAREVAPIEVEPATQVRAQWMYPEEASSANPMLDDLQIVARMSDEHIESLGEALKRVVGGEGGFTTREALGRLAAAGAGAAFFYPTLDEDMSDGRKNVFRAVGMMLMIGAAGPLLSKMYERKFIKGLINNVDPTVNFTNAGAKEAGRLYFEKMSWARENAYRQRKVIEEVVKPADHRNFVIAVDEMDPANGNFPAEFFQLTREQQTLALGVNQFNLALGHLLKREGILDAYVENYVSHRLPPETFQRWRTSGFHAPPTGGSFTKPRKITSWRDLEAWAAQNGLPGPISDVAELQSSHITEAYRALGYVRLHRELEGLGLIQDMPKAATTALPDGWRQVGVLGLGKKMAPEAVAKALENITAPATSERTLLGAADTIKSWWMRSIMFWWWEHGLNAARAASLVSVNPYRYAEAWQAVKRMDSGLVEAARYGTNFRTRTDYAELAKSVDKAIAATGRIPVLNQIVRGVGGLMKWNDTLLWEKIIPTAQYMVWTKEMSNWAQRTGHAFLPGSPQYVAAARRASDIANLAFGKVATDMASPTFMAWMRLVSFSPQWTGSRLGMTLKAGGELGDVLAGKLNPRDAAFLQMKLRQVALMAAGTWVMSKMFTGKEPEFNPDTHKFYVRTGLRNDAGREVGVDLLGWWQDELKVFNNPLDYVKDRLNPALKSIGSIISGRDFAGRDMTIPQRALDVVRSAGPPSELAELIARVAIPGAPKMSSGELMQRVSGVLATGNVAALPRPFDVAVARMAEKLLGNAGVPKNKYLVFELSQILRSNIFAGQDLIDNKVITYLAYRRRSHAVHDPLPVAGEWLWQQGRKVLADF